MQGGLDPGLGALMLFVLAGDQAGNVDEGQGHVFAAATLAQRLLNAVDQAFGIQHGWSPGLGKAEGRAVINQGAGNRRGNLRQAECA